MEDVHALTPEKAGNWRSLELSWTWHPATALACVLLGLAVIFLAHRAALWTASESGSGERAGELQRVEGSVRARGAEQAEWNDVGDRRELGFGDWIFTGGDGIALVELEDGRRARLLPGTSVRIERLVNEAGVAGWLERALGFRRAEPVLRVSQGTVRIEKKADARPVAVSIFKQSLRVESQAEIRVEGSGDASRAVLRGDDSSPLSVSPLDARDAVDWPAPDSARGTPELVLSPEGRISLREAGVRLLAPVNGEVLWPTEGAPDPERVAVELSWETDSTAEGEPLLLEVAGPAEGAGNAGETRSFKAAPGESSRTLNLSSGEYRWRIAGASPSSWSAFRVITLASPRPVAPVEGATIPIGEGEARISVTVGWKPLPAPLRSEVEVIPESSATDRFEVAGSQSGAELRVAPGTYYWRVRGWASESRFSAWTRWRKFRVAPLKVTLTGVRPEQAGILVLPPPSRPVAPRVVVESPAAQPPSRVSVPAVVPKGPANGSEVPATGRLVLTWEKATVDHYDVELSRDSAFHDVILRQSPAGNWWVAEPRPGPGSYFWRVRGAAADGSSGEWSAAFGFTVR
jgi:hypothetical protein